MVTTECAQCDGTGFVVDEADGASSARRCRCAERPRTEVDLVAAGLPRRYMHCSFDNYRPFNALQKKAAAIAKTFVETYPDVTRGLLFTGNCGAGKTHLAAAILRQLMLEQGVSAVFADYQDLLKRIQATYSRGGEQASENDVLAPVLVAEVLVLDDLGSRRSTPWAEEMLGHVLTVRYNEERTTILTTNLLDIEAGPETLDHVPGDTVLLSERVSERVLSRLHEMCRVVHVEGPDFRRLGKS